MEREHITPTVPACPEDALIAARRAGWACGPARDDVLALTTHTQDCEYLIGSGSYSGGYWSQYTCAVVEVPNTSMAGHDAPLVWDGAIVIMLLLVAIIAQATARHMR